MVSKSRALLHVLRKRWLVEYDERRWSATGTASDDDERCGKTEQWSHAFH
jgi:hypothetical protein